MIFFLICVAVISGSDMDLFHSLLAKEATAVDLEGAEAIQSELRQVGVRLKDAYMQALNRYDVVRSSGKTWFVARIYRNFLKAASDYHSFLKWEGDVKGRTNVELQVEESRSRLQIMEKSNNFKTALVHTAILAGFLADFNFNRANRRPSALGSLLADNGFGVGIPAYVHGAGIASALGRMASESLLHLTS